MAPDFQSNISEVIECQFPDSFDRTLNFVGASHPGRNYTYKIQQIEKPGRISGSIKTQVIYGFGYVQTIDLCKIRTVYQGRNIAFRFEERFCI